MTQKIIFKVLILACALVFQMENASAFPTTSAAKPWGHSYSVLMAAPGFHFDGIVGMSNCSASFVRFKQSSENDLGMVLTNGHCTGGEFGRMMRPGEVYYNQARRYSVYLLDQNANRIATLRAEKIIYATMTNTDMALLQLNQTYREIKQATGVDALVLADHRSEPGLAIEIPSGYWKRTYTCQLEAFVPTLKEAQWTFKDSLRYSESGCEVIGGTSGSPIVSASSGEVVAINNTGNESGQRCTMNNPCEVDEAGNVKVIPGRGYGQQIYWVYACLNAQGVFDLSVPTCTLPKGN